MHGTHTKAGPPAHPLLHLHATTTTRYVDSESAIAIFSAALHARDICTHSHCRRVIHYALTLGRLLGLSSQELATLERGVFLHDVGKIYVPDSVLRKPGHLTERERMVMQQHPAVGYEMVSAFASLADVSEIVLSHHERFDGTGYPFGLKGEAIPLGARICAIADTLDALTSHRPYRSPMSFAAACAYVESEGGTHFDPLLIEHFMAITPAGWQTIRHHSAHDDPLAA
jgi:putative nucleotidyltransferase with HDIG domain